MPSWPISDPNEVRYPDKLPQENAEPSSESSIIQLKTASQDTLVEPGNLVLEMSPDKESGMAEVTDIVDWDGPEDPENRMNWPKRKRLSHVALVSIIVFLVSV
jgi:hypothetical protein